MVVPPEPIIGPQLVGFSYVARALGVSESAFRYQIRENKSPVKPNAHLVDSGRMLFDRRDVEIAVAQKSHA